MLALKKKREAEKKEKEAAAAAAAAEETAANATQQPEKVSLLGIGGKKKTKSEEGDKTGKKRSPGEIRIQKGM